LENLDIGDLSNDDRAALFSVALTYHGVSHCAQEFMVSWLEKWQKMQVKSLIIEKIKSI
jgi:hypothetical protein